MRDPIRPVCFFVLVALVMIAAIIVMSNPVPPRVTPLPPVVPVVEPVTITPVYKEKVKHKPKRAIFCDDVGCPAYYNDRDLIKVGSKGLKYYEWADVIVGDEP